MSTDLIDALIGCWGSWGPSLSPDGERVAYLSDRDGRPEVWVQSLSSPDQIGPDAPKVLRFGDDPVVSVRWSSDGEWLACAVAHGGGVRTQVWVMRPDGSHARPIAGGPDEHAILGPWSRAGRRLVVALPPTKPGGSSRCDLLDPITGEREPVARGGLVDVLDLSVGERFALLRDGGRGTHFCLTLDRELDADHPLLPYPQTGSTDAGVLRPSPDDEQLLTAYLITDAGLPRAALAAVSVGPEGVRGTAGILAQRDDGELEHLDADDSGRLLALIWNISGRSEFELLDPLTGARTPIDSLPGPVVTACTLARDGRLAVLCIHGPGHPQQLWQFDIATHTWRQLTDSPAPSLPVVEPTLERFVAHDGLPLTGWLYRARSTDGPGPLLISLHGGPESQERPGFDANHQAVAAAGISVFAPNVRGSAGFGRAFAHADDRFGRYEAITDVRSCVQHVIDIGVADPDRIAVSGRSYGGYLTLAALVHFPKVFAVGIDICGMSNFLTFFRDTEPWIAAAAIPKYGDPNHDHGLLEDLSPLDRVSRISVPLLVIHGALDTNVPLTEATQLVAALRAIGGPVDYLELAGEGHEYRARESRRTLLERMVGFLSEHLIEG